MSSKRILPDFIHKYASKVQRHNEITVIEDNEVEIICAPKSPRMFVKCLAYRCNRNCSKKSYNNQFCNRHLDYYNEQPDCSICMNIIDYNFTSSDIFLGCGHRVHKKCLSNHQTCPSCNSPILLREETRLQMINEQIDTLTLDDEINTIEIENTCDVNTINTILIENTYNTTLINNNYNTYRY